MKIGPRNKSVSFLSSRWTAYATAAAATGFGAATSEAEIHYSGPVHKKLTGISSENFPLSNGVSIRLFEVSFPLSSYPFAGFRILNAPVAHGFRAVSFYSEVLRLAAKDAVSSGTFRETNHTSTSWGNIQSFYGRNPFWNDGRTGFIGFKFDTGAGVQYGWVRLKMTRAPMVWMNVIDFAWGDPGDRIKAGQINSRVNESAVVPDKGSLGLLALGGAGLVAWRNRRRQDGSGSQRK
jgi:hypothetical protein